MPPEVSPSPAVLIASYSLLCSLLNAVSISIFPAVFPIISTLEASLQYQMFTKVTSTAHAIGMFAMTAYYFLYINTKWEIDFVSDSNHTHESLCTYAMIGYLIYDTLIELKPYFSPKSKGNKIEFEFIIHHILGLISHVTTLYYRKPCAFYFTMAVFVAELSTPFLNITWTLHHLKMKDSKLYSIFILLLPLTFFLSRIVLSPIILYQIVTTRHLWGPEQIDYYLWFGNCIVIVLFVLLNYYWFAKLLAIALGGKEKEKKKEKKDQ